MTVKLAGDGPGPEIEILEDSIARCAAGDTGGLRELYERARAPVYAMALSSLKNSHDAEEITQETFVRVYRAAPGYVPEGKPMAWLLTVTRNLAMSRLRKRGRTQPLDDDALSSLEAKPGVSAEDRLMLSTLLAGLRDDERQVVVLHAAAGLRHREIAEIMELPLSTVLSKYDRAIKKLQKAWKEAEG